MTSKESQRKRNQRYYLRHREKENLRCRRYSESRNGFESRLKRLYNVTLEWFDEQIQKQCGRCAVCNQIFSDFDVDHDHRTGKARGLLCHGCNMLVGYLEKFSELLPNAFDYLQ